MTTREQLCTDNNPLYNKSVRRSDLLHLIQERCYDGV